MARSPNEKLIKAKKLYDKGYKLIDISKELDIPEGTIRSWKNRYSWDNDNNATLQKEEKKKRNVANKSATKKKAKKEPIADEVKEVMENDELTDKQKDFCIYYVKYRNKTKAYMKAYKCSYSNACSHAWELWKNVEIKKEINRLLSEVRDNLKIDIQDLIQLNIDIAFADMKDYVEFGQEEVPVMGPFGPIIVKQKGKPAKEITKIVNVVKFKESSEVDGTIISEVKQGKDGASIKLQDKMKAIDFLDKHINYLDEETKRKLDIEHKRLENDKVKAEITKITGEDEPEVEDDGFLEALKGRTAEVWKNE